jgi:cell division transport system permease protein
MEGVTSDLLPASLEITLKRGSRDSESVETFVSRLKKIQGIGEVQYGEEWVRKLTTFMQFSRFVVTLVGGFLLISVLFIVSNTIKLTIYARKDELELLSLVGATRFFIKAPFLIEGVIQGIAGSILALILLAGSYYALLYNAADFLSLTPTSSGLQFLPPAYLAGILLTGVFLGFIGSLTSLKRFITF